MTLLETVRAHAPRINDVSRATRAAVEEIARCTDRFDDLAVSASDDRSLELAECVDALLDAGASLSAASAVLERTMRPGRVAVIRRVVEAGLVAAVECAAKCDAWRDEMSTAARCADRCHACADDLRAVLRELSDESAEAMSGAT